MFEIINLILPMLAFNKFVKFRPILSKNSRHRWLFRIFVLLFTFIMISAWIWPYFNKNMLFLVSVLPLIPYFLLNRKKLYILVFVAGIFTNHLTVILNNGYMPVSKKATIQWKGKLIDTKPDGEIILNQLYRYKYINKETILPFFGDIIYFPYANAISSIGDWLSFLAFLIFLLTKINGNKLGQ